MLSDHLNSKFDELTEDSNFIEELDCKFIE